MLEQVNLIGAISALSYFASCILIFIFRLTGMAGAGHRLGLFQTLLMAVVVVYLLVAAPRYGRPTIYYIQLGLMLIFLGVELFLDTLLKIDFRRVRWMVVGYVTLFFAATGGMLGVASQAGRVWSVSATGLFLIMAALAFWQRAATGK